MAGARSVESQSFNPAAVIPEPFREDWWMDADPPEVSYLLSPADRVRITAIGSDFDFNLAAALDKAVNGTSLMLMLKIDGRRPVSSVSGGRPLGYVAGCS